MTTYGVFHKETGVRLFTGSANSEKEILDIWASHRSGYATLGEMTRSATFREFANVHAYPISR